MPLYLRVDFKYCTHISDFGDSSKDNTFHQVASEAAAIVTKDYATYGWSRI
ncbi:MULTISPECIES: hypothetical protein [Pseudomonas]|jgi:hypothetical protein|uniref:Uncharacterized protein n=1 Tax=Pseudomonas putida (strain ATCC 47054 / DSM 6125 / CFBP 8728 / NCIMB 11950 / KT2440) TaxID=160488 RepID=Q88GN8_PSEPK|nr:MULTISPECIES: hypothetical protein [Pseudomonas]AAN69280.1 conserved protein of unknown function [Pseudomonas putida KT2440]MDD2079565.1 hypothetical protein [Pseudomonas putida]UUX28162.1 hypothetical protein M8003_19235 [Pseudomonas putida]UUX66765.1 hypothetical protein M8001_19235 [Pseudomonas putida]UUX72242.1 hypothetical protein M8000_19240 [Pseudomonas putida]